jgi:hypothetical protein
MGEQCCSNVCAYIHMGSEHSPSLAGQLHQTCGHIANNPPSNFGVLEKNVTPETGNTTPYRKVLNPLS